MTDLPIARRLESMLQGASDEVQLSLPPSSVPPPVLAARAVSMGWDVVEVDGRVMVDKATALLEFARGGAFPDWVGHNLDALADALGDLSWRPSMPHVILWRHARVLEARDADAAKGIDDVLSDVGVPGELITIRL